jgi:hypothetical protein
LPLIGASGLRGEGLNKLAPISFQGHCNLTQVINALSWQEQSDATQPLANYTVNFATDLVWQFQLSTGMYHFQPINPAGVTIDNSNGGGTITLASAAFTVNILPYSREDIDLSNASQQLKLSYIGASQSPSVAPYSLPIVFWIKKPSGAQQNQYAINQAVQTAIASSVLGNMQPIINSGFTEWPQGASISVGAAAIYTAEGWMARGGAGPACTVSQVALAGTFPAPFGLSAQRKAGSAVVTAIQVGTALTSNDSAQFAGQQFTVSFDLVLGVNFSGVNLTCSVFSGTGTDQNVFMPFTGATLLGSSTVPAGTVAGRQSFVVATSMPINATQLGLIFSYSPVGVAGASDLFQISRPQIDLGTIAQAFRTVPQIMEKQRCLAFFEVLNSEGITNYPFAAGVCFSATTMFGGVDYVKKRAIPTISFGSNYVIVIAGGFQSVNSINLAGGGSLGLDKVGLQFGTPSGLTANAGGLVVSNAGTATMTLNARM